MTTHLVLLELPGEIEAARAAVERVASDGGRYGQYLGYFEGWEFATLTQDIRTKGGHAGAKGERVLARRFSHRGGMAFWSNRLGWVVGIDTQRWALNFENEE